jgi:hypothetical protein
VLSTIALRLKVTRISVPPYSMNQTLVSWVWMSGSPSTVVRGKRNKTPRTLPALDRANSTPDGAILRLELAHW